MGERPMRNDPTWYKDAIIYEVPVRAFFDSNDDGVGDFRGLASKLDYIQDLGATALWLLPFYPSPLRDGGYDISDYMSVSPQFGTMRDFTRFVRMAHDRGLHVITELVLNHTSDQHPWFQRARKAKRGSAARDMYVWSDTGTEYADTRIIFLDTEQSNWAWDPEAGQYYWHRFFSHQPDLNYDNPRVFDELLRVLAFWFDRGVDGVRLDAVPYLVEREGTNCENLPETHAILKRIRRWVDERYGDRLLLAEANQWPSDAVAYFGEGEGDECHMNFHFPLMPRMFMAIYQEDRHPITEILAQTPEIPPLAQWGLFLRNHDELTLEMVTDAERDYMYQVYAADPQMRLNLGIRRRLAPLLYNSRRRMELMNALLLSMPGTPILYYGDEIGMGDNIYLGDRDGVRTPMQWTPDRNGGFSRADQARLYLPPIVDPEYGYQAVNVEAQERSPSSLLNWMRRMLALRRGNRVFARGSIETLHPENRAVLAFTREYEGEVILVVANLARSVQPVELDLGRFEGMVPVEMIGSTTFPPVPASGRYFLALGPHSFYWFRMERAPEPVVVTTPGEHLQTISLNGDWDELFEGSALRKLERQVLPANLASTRWFGARGRRVRSMRLVDVAGAGIVARPVWLTIWEARFERGPAETYQVPLALLTGRAGRDLMHEQPEMALALVEGQRGRGVLVDAMADESASLLLLEAVHRRRTATGRRGRFVMTPERAFNALYEALDDPPEVHRASGEQSNTSVRFGSQLIMKFYRRLQAGAHPEVEVGRVLAQSSRDVRAPRLAGSVEYQPERGEPTATAIVHEYAWSQGDGWNYGVHEATRFLEGARGHSPDGDSTATSPGSELADEELAALASGFFVNAEVLGRRTAEMHLALAEAADDAFTPEPVEAKDTQELVRSIRERSDRVSRMLGEAKQDAPDDAATLAEIRGVATRLRRRLRAGNLGLAIRCHGDYHLGQVLWVENDFYIVDFEGEVNRPLPERRHRTSPLRDVAGMLRSFQYAAETARRQLLENLPQHTPGAERLAAWARWWQQHASEAFMRGYLASEEILALLPVEAATRDALLRAFMLDKALYEVEYEVRNRPEWVGVPLAGISALLDDEPSR